MSCTFVTGAISMNSAIRIDATSSCLDLENIPFTQRPNSLPTNSHSADSDSPIVQNECHKALTPPLDATVKKEYEDCDLQEA